MKHTGVDKQGVLRVGTLSKLDSNNEFALLLEATWAIDPEKPWEQSSETSDVLVHTNTLEPLEW
jgi:hypothetical protein